MGAAKFSRAPLSEDNDPLSCEVGRGLLQVICEVCEEMLVLV